MPDDDYISIPVTPEILEDPDEPCPHPLEAMMRRLEAQWFKDGFPVSRRELRPGAEPGYIVNFIPKMGVPRLTVEMREVTEETCPACGTLLERDGRCCACWGDVMGLCDICGGLLDDGYVCPTCARDEHSTSPA